MYIFYRSTQVWLSQLWTREYFTYINLHKYPEGNGFWISFLRLLASASLAAAVIIQVQGDYEVDSSGGSNDLTTFTATADFSASRNFVGQLRLGDVPLCRNLMLPICEELEVKLTNS